MKLADIVKKKQLVPATKEDREQAAKGSSQFWKEGLAGQHGKSAKIGNTFEKEIKETCDLYEDFNIAYIQKFPTPTIWIPPRNGKAGFMMYQKKTGFDYIGVTFEDNKPIFIEVKSTKDGVIPVGGDTNGIKAHQIARMKWLEDRGINVFFLWQVRFADAVVYKFTPTQMIEAIGTKKSMSIVDCEEYRFVKMLKMKFKDRMVYDFLYKLEENNESI